VGNLAYRLWEVNVVKLLGLPAIEEEMQRLEPLLMESVVTGDDFLDDVTTHLIAAGGKRLRPVLALATATSDSHAATREDLLGAAAVELVHLASLYHDDVMDEATIRRNVESVNSRFGNLVAIVAGDFLLARSAEIAAGLGTETAALLASTLGELCRGQVAEVRSAFQIGRTRDDYTNAVAGKTAALMATSCRIGALTGGLPRQQVEAFTMFGRYFGMTFQVRDDILDIVGSEAELGKPAGQDLAEGIYTLPVLLALADPDAGPELQPLLGQPLDQPERDKARSIVAASSAIAGSVSIGRQFADQAARAAADCPSADLAAGFARLAHSLIDGLPTG
jgi:heptaprenyl diphosphate synthase